MRPQTSGQSSLVGFSDVRRFCALTLTCCLFDNRNGIRAVKNVHHFISNGFPPGQQEEEDRRNHRLLQVHSENSRTTQSSRCAQCRYRAVHIRRVIRERSESNVKALCDTSVKSGSWPYFIFLFFDFRCLAMPFRWCSDGQ